MAAPNSQWSAYYFTSKKGLWYLEKPSFTTCVRTSTNENQDMYLKEGWKVVDRMGVNIYQGQAAKNCLTKNHQEQKELSRNISIRKILSKIQEAMVEEVCDNFAERNEFK